MRRLNKSHPTNQQKAVIVRAYKSEPNMEPASGSKNPPNSHLVTESIAPSPEGMKAILKVMARRMESIYIASGFIPNTWNGMVQRDFPFISMIQRRMPRLSMDRPEVRSTKVLVQSGLLIGNTRPHSREMTTPAIP